MTTADSTFLTLEDAAQRVHVSVKTVRRYIAAGRLTGYRVGPSLIRLDPVEVDALLRPMRAMPRPASVPRTRAQHRAEALRWMADLLESRS